MLSKSTYFGLPSVRFNDHEEKPSERIPSPFLVLLLAFYLLIAYVTKVIEDDLPNVVLEKDIDNNDPTTFSEEAAKRYLHRILGDRPRVSGTVYHLAKTRDLKELVDEIANSSNLPVHTDWQFVSGDYWLACSSPHVKSYQNASNIIAVLEGESGVNDGTIGTSVLVNCHYDSVPFAIGASDNGVFCAAMAETLSKLSRRKIKFKHNIIFLFNGAEEGALLASHGFLQHPWSKNVTGLVNLDSAGMNGNPSVFQVTDPRVLEAYRRTSRNPNAQGLGEVLFASGAIPSDTDFRIFRDFGGIHGIDIAFIKGGNIYHTRNDRPELIQDGVLQNAGNMLLGLLSELADCEHLENKEPQSTLVYYDFVSLFLVTYSQTTAQWLDIFVGIFGLSTVMYYLKLFGFRLSMVQELLWAALSRLVCVGVGVGAVYLFTLLMMATTTQLRYLSKQWLVIPLYWVPYVIIAVITSHMFDSWRSNKKNLNRSIRASQAMCATRLLLSSSLLLLCCFPALSNMRYVITVPLVIMSFGSFVTMSYVRFRRTNAWQHLLLEVSLSLPSGVFSLSLSSRLLALLLPIAGRSASERPDLTVALVTAGLAAVATTTVSGIELLFHKKHLSIVGGGALLLCAVAMFLPLNPYEGDATQRHYWFHTQIITYDANFTQTDIKSGVLMTKLDANSIQSSIDAIKRAPFYGNERGSFTITNGDLNLMSDSCDTLFCNLPLYRPRFGKFNKGSLFVTMSPPKYFEHSLVLTNRSCVRDDCKLHFIMNGPSQNTITIWPRKNVTVSGWSFESPPSASSSLDGRPVYVIILSTATYKERFDPLEFHVTFTVPKYLQQEVVVDISHHALKIHHPEEFTSQYKMLIEAMPDYFNIATFIAFRSNYVY